MGFKLKASGLDSGDGDLVLSREDGNGDTQAFMTIKADELVINEGSLQSMDFRVEGDDTTSLLHTESAEDRVRLGGQEWKTGVVSVGFEEAVRVDNWNPTGWAQASRIHIALSLSEGFFTISGIENGLVSGDASDLDGRILFIVNTRASYSGSKIEILEDSTYSYSDNRFDHGGKGSLYLDQGQTAMYILTYAEWTGDPYRWSLISTIGSFGGVY